MLETNADKSNLRSVKGFLISPRQQIEQVAFIVFALSCGMGILGLIFFIYSVQISQIAIEAGANAELIHSLTQKALVYFVLALMGMIFIFSALNIMYTHRWFGALFAIQRYLQNLLDGNFDTELKIRKSDQTHELADLVRKVSLKMKAQSPNKPS